MITSAARDQSQQLKAYAFQQTEYDNRVLRAREKMAEAEIDVLLVTDLSNICYLTGFQTLVSDWYSCLIIPSQGDLVLHVCDLEVALCRVHTNVEHIELIRWNRMDEAAPQLAQIIAGLGRTPKSIGLESRQRELTPYAYATICSAFPNAIMADASDIVFHLRAVKSPAEIAYMRKAGAYSVAGLLAAEAAIQEGVMDNEVAAAASAAMIRAGSEYFSIDPIIRAGDWHAVVHSSFRRNRIRQGDTVIMEMSGVHERYNAPIYSTAVVGRASDDTRRLADAALYCVETLYSNLRPGRTMHDVATSTKSALRGLDERIHLNEYFAYPIGLSFPPSWPENSVWIIEGSDKVLTPGMCFHAVRSFRIFGVIAAGFSDAIAITETGYEILTPHQKRLLEVPN